MGRAHRFSPKNMPPRRVGPVSLRSSPRSVPAALVPGACGNPVDIAYEQEKNATTDPPS
jgi:hypothetical protein